jgi:hypothetical protein
MADLALAIVHHLIVFGIAAVLAAELALMRPAAMSPPTVKLLGRCDAAYGLLALAILAAGFIRVWYAAQGPDYYLHNHAFWAKTAAFAIVGHRRLAKGGLHAAAGGSRQAAQDAADRDPRVRPDPDLCRDDGARRRLWGRLNRIRRT